MNHKQWIKLYITGTLTVILSIFITFISINPYQLFENSLTEKKFYNTKYYSIKLFDMLKEKKYSLIFGTSRSQRIQTDNSGIPLLNFSSSLYGNSMSVLNFLQQLDKKQLSNIERIYYLIDDHCLNGSSDNDAFLKYYDIDFKSSYLNYTLKELSYVNEKKIIELVNDVTWNIFGNYSYYLLKNGAMFRVNKNESCNVPKEYKSKGTPQYFQKDGIDALIAINDFCLKNNIKIDYYTDTHFDKYAKLMDSSVMLDKWSQLLDGGIQGFYALWYIDGVSNLIQDNKYIAYSDTISHLNEYYVHKVFIDNVVKHNKKYFINNKLELKEYLLKNKEYFK